MSVLAVVALVALVPFVVWGARTDPDRPFSWGMYSDSSKGYLWTGARPVDLAELRLAPGSHFLNLAVLRHYLAGADPDVPIEGLIIASAGSCRVRYDPTRHHLDVTTIEPGTELDVLGAELGRLAAERVSR